MGINQWTDAAATAKDTLLVATSIEFNTNYLLPNIRNVTQLKHFQREPIYKQKQQNFVTRKPILYILKQINNIK